MNDRWKTKKGARWNRAEKIRVARMFRHHIDTPYNRAHNKSCRIKREPCFFCVQNARAGGYPREEHLPFAPFHHLDYRRPFYGVWACDSHHRQVDHKTLYVPVKATRDYTSDVMIVAKVGLRRAERRTSKVEPPPPARGPLGSICVVEEEPVESEVPF